MTGIRTVVSALLGGILMLLTGSQIARTETAPPIARISPQELEKHGHIRTDNYYWLKERENPEVIEYLEAENRYTDSVMAPVKEFEDALFEEIKGRIKKDDRSVPYIKSGYYYYRRFEEGQEYPLYCRKNGSLESDEEIMLDENILAQCHEYFRVGNWKVSSNNNLLSYAVDTIGRRIYTIKFKNLNTGADLSDTISDITGGMAWANDNQTLFYSRQDPKTLRSFQIWKHKLGTDAAEDALVYEEKDETFSCYVMKSKSDKYIFIASYQTISHEYRYLDADNPDGDFAVFLPRERGHEYDVEHYDDKFFIKTNREATNFKLMSTPTSSTSFENWRDVIGHREDVFFEAFEIFKNYLVVVERENGLIRLRIRPWESASSEHYMDFKEPTYDVSLGANKDFDTEILRYEYTSLTTPNSTYDYNMNSREKDLLKREEVLGAFDPENYVTERHFATASDGVKVPISLVYREGMIKDGSNPLLLYGYGSYGFSRDATFRSYRLSLIDRGFVYAIAHVRGGQEMGRKWYEDGKLLSKKNTFTDFISCAEYLVEKKFTNSEKLFAQGGSAGGLLVGAVINMRSNLFKGAVAAVPFVDVITTMLDEDIPLTTSEYDEWGNPNQKEYYDYILSYSPYDNVEKKDYTNLLVTTGLHDSQVQYWEPAKWVAKLRALKTDSNRLLLKTNMDAGHGGASGRFKRYREIALDYAFMLDLVGIRE